MSFSQFGDSPGVINLDDKDAVLSGFRRLLFQGHYGRCEKMKNDLFPSLDFTCLQNWSRKLVGKFHDAGIHQITLREYNLWNKETPELAKAVRLRSKSHPQYLVIIHLSKQYEHQSRREELIRAVHGPTIWDEQNYLALGIGTAFLDCLKRPTISKLCEEMQRFVFWCYGAQQDENSPETNGYAWPLHADPKEISWLLYPEASSDGKPQIPFPDRFSASSSGTIQEQVDMKFISEIRDIDDEAYVSFKELKQKGIDADNVELMSQYDKISGYRFLFMGVAYESQILSQNYDNERPNDLADIPRDVRIGFLRQFKGLKYYTVEKYLEGLEQRTVDSSLGIVEYSRTMTDGVKYIFRKYSLHEYLRRSFLGFEIFPVPTQLEKIDDYPAAEVFFKRLEIEDMLPVPGVTPDQPTDPVLEWLGTVPMCEINRLWKAFLKSQNDYIEKEKSRRGKITREQIGRAELKIIIKSISAGSSLPDYIINGLTLKYTASREKEGFFCDIVRQMAKKEGKQEIATLRNEVFYENIRKIMNAF